MLTCLKIPIHNLDTLTYINLIKSIIIGGVIMSSQITDTQSSNIHRLAHIYLTPTPWFSVVAPWFSVVAAFFTIYPNLIICNGIPPLSGWKPPEHERAVLKNTAQSKNGDVKLIKSHMYQGSPLFPIFRALSLSLHHHSSFAQATFTPSIQPNLGLHRVEETWRKRTKSKLLDVNRF